MHWSNEFVGLPYERFGRNCMVFFNQVQMAQFNILNPVIDVDPKNTKARLRAFNDGMNYADWVEVVTPVEGDAVLMGQRDIASHIGVYIHCGYGAVLHCDDVLNSFGGGVVINRLSDFDGKNGRSIIKYYRHRDKL